MKKTLNKHSRALLVCLLAAALVGCGGAAMTDTDLEEPKEAGAAVDPGLETADETDSTDYRSGFYAYTKANMKANLARETEEMAMTLTGGGLLDFDNDGAEDLVLVYKGDDAYLTELCKVVKTTPDGVTPLFEIVLSDGGNWGQYEILSRNGKGCISVYTHPYPEGNGIHAQGGFSRGYYVYEQGNYNRLSNNDEQVELSLKLYIYCNNYVSDYGRDKPDYQIWSIEKDGAVVDSGTAEGDATIPEVEAALAEAEATYGPSWQPIPLEQLLDELR
jgi:hypothetical protein